DSRIDLPPPKTDSSPPPERSSSTSINKSVSASRMRSPVVGPYDATYSERDTLLIHVSSTQAPQTGNDSFTTDRDQLDFHHGPRFETNGAAGQHIKPLAPGRIAIELQSGVDFGKME